MEASRGDRLVEQLELGDTQVPEVVIELASPEEPEFVWKNEIGGLTFRTTDRFIKWNPAANGLDLALERDRIEWLSARHPAPRVLDFGQDQKSQWLVTEALPAESAVADRWKAQPLVAVRAIAQGLRAIHAVNTGDFPADWSATSWISENPESLSPKPACEDPVLVHGDACAPNTLIDSDGNWAGHVDLGDLAVGDRWADLAVAAMSLEWNYGSGFEAEFYAAYGIKPDGDRIAYYQDLWDLES